MQHRKILRQSRSHIMLSKPSSTELNCLKRRSNSLATENSVKFHIATSARSSIKVFTFVCVCVCAPVCLSAGTVRR